MRSTVQLQRPGGGGGEADGDGDSEPGVPCFCWWRSLPEYEAGAGLETPKAANTRTATARMRVVRELERLAAAASESIDELRHRLLTYKAGDLWFPAGGITKQDTDIPPVITLLLLGFAGVGKSSLVNLMYSVLGRSGFVPFAHTSSPAGKEGRTLNLEEHNVLRSMKSGFCVFDSPGLDYDHISEGFDEVSHWVEDGVRHRQLCHMSPSSSSSSFPSFPSTSTSTSSSAAAGNRFMRRRVNCAFVVANLSELHSSLASGHLQPLDATRQLFHHPSIRESCNDAPILILTHGDELTEDERIDTRVALCDYLGVAETSGVYDIPCLNEHGVHIDEFEPVTAYAVAEAVYRALVVADRCHPPKPGLKDWLLVALSWAMCALSAFFAFLSCFCSKLAKLNRDYQKKR
ncbi:uncharacterized protein LOC110104421 [Dendrobium catenatum]|uniref:G domain-containing protein n=1 Tax=Dendrobium catenatum TaxID=906689 RepID=A0A2I0XFS9_9ASPA|nr:uncharacterized protein LOC110104421 [Dendrobium catenatum]PKU86768.1 hypothetical protein MA16_Dca020815 [Dendrobium catenatum]